MSWRVLSLGHWLQGNWSGKASMDDLSLDLASAIWRQLPDRRSPRSRVALSGSSWKTSGSCREGGGSSAPYSKGELWVQSEKGALLDNFKLIDKVETRVLIQTGMKLADWRWARVV